MGLSIEIIAGNISVYYYFNLFYTSTSAGSYYIIIIIIIIKRVTMGIWSRVSESPSHAVFSHVNISFLLGISTVL